MTTVVLSQPELFRRTDLFAAVLVVFGCPSKNCAGQGICTTALPQNAHLYTCPAAPAFVGLAPSGRPQFHFPKDSEKTQSNNWRFAQRTFRLEERFVLPSFLNQMLQSATPLTLLPGIYPVVESERYFTVLF